MVRRAAVPLSLGLALGALVLLAWAGWTGWTARAELLSARAAVQSLQDDDVDQTRTSVMVTQAADAARRAERRLSTPGPRFVAAWPLVGRSLTAERSVARSSSALLDLAEQALPLTTRATAAGGAVDLDTLRALSDLVAGSAPEVSAAARELSVVGTGKTPGAVRRAVLEAQQLLLPAAAAVESADAGLRAAHGLLGGDGPRTLVVGVMNNAEVRGAGGYVPSIAVVRLSDGVAEVGEFIDTNELDDPPQTAVRVPAPPEYSRRWGRYLADSTLWKNVTMSPHVPDSSAVLCEVARLRPGVDCDGVVLLDVPALAEIMSLSGPVDIGGEQLVGDVLVRALLVEAYADAEELGLAQAERRAALLDAADGAIAQLLGEQLTGLPVLRLLGRTAAGRHLSVWSSRDDEQRDLETAGLTGSADPDGGDLSLVSLNQLSAGKLDYYLRRELTVSVEVAETTATVEQRVRLVLDHPEELPAYVLGVREGRLDHLVDLGLSGAARDVELLVDGQAVAVDLVRDRGSQRASVVSSLRSPETRELILRYTVPLPDGTYRLTLLPQPLAEPAQLQIRVEAAEGHVLRDGPVRTSGPFGAATVVEARADRPSWWSRPVELPW
jgi:hypothetical protein